jgi:DNA-binding XRE family transcriptional regulator
METKQKLIGYRKMAGLTQDEMADKLKISRSTYLKKENAPGKITFEEQKMIQEILSQKIPELPNIFL